MTDMNPTAPAWAQEQLLLTPEQAAAVLHVGRTTIFALMKAGDLRPVHIGRSCRVSRAEIERYIQRLEGSAPERTAAVTARRSARQRGRTRGQSGLFEIDDNPTPPDAA